MKYLKLLSALFVLGALAFCGLARAADESSIDISKVTTGLARPIPVSLMGFSGEALAVLKFDLEVGGCEIVSGDSAQFAVSGSNNGQVLGELRDQVTRQVLLNNRYSGSSIRSQAHAFADDLLLKITGRPGVSKFKLAFKGQSGSKSEIYISDFDGANAIAVTQDNALVAAPTWVPGKRILYYTSYKSNYPDIYSHDLTTGNRRIVANYPGLNTSPAVSPDGRSVAMILSRSGSPDLYVCDAEGKNLRQITKTREDESSPCWSPDGRSICFVSTASGVPSLFVVPAAGGAPRRLKTTGAGRVSEPDWSPDGKYIAFTAMRREFDICVVPAEGGDSVTLATGEDPSWAPNSRTIVFTRRSKGKSVLSLLDVPTKRVKDVAHVLGNCSQPGWAK
jgi:TolB protein